MFLQIKINCDKYTLVSRKSIAINFYRRKRTFPLLILSVTFFKIHTNLKCREYDRANRPPSTFHSSHYIKIIELQINWCKWHPFCIPTSFSLAGREFMLVRKFFLWRIWLSHCATSQKFAVSICVGVIGIFYWRSPSGCTMVLGLTQPLTEMSTRNNSWGGGKGGRCVGLTTLPLSRAGCLQIWEPQSPGALRTFPGLQWDYCTLRKLSIWIFLNFILTSTILIVIFLNSCYYCTSIILLFPVHMFVVINQINLVSQIRSF
jgi:hypothetical protein